MTDSTFCSDLSHIAAGNKSEKLCVWIRLLVLHNLLYHRTCHFGLVDGVRFTFWKHIFSAEMRIHKTDRNIRASRLFPDTRGSTVIVLSVSFSMGASVGMHSRKKVKMLYDVRVCGTAWAGLIKSPRWINISYYILILISSCNRALFV